MDSPFADTPFGPALDPLTSAIVLDPKDPVIY